MAKLWIFSPGGGLPGSPRAVKSISWCEKYLKGFQLGEPEAPLDAWNRLEFTGSGKWIVVSVDTSDSVLSSSQGFYPLVDVTPAELEKKLADHEEFR